jgi:hypothetical protein
MNLSAYPVTAGNISQTLFQQNEKLVVPSDSVSVAYQNLTSLSGVNSMPQEINNIREQMPAYMSQAHLSTWYQDNPWDILTYSKKFGLSPMGGNLELDQGSGFKPGNTLRNYNGKNNSMKHQPMKHQTVIQEMRSMPIMKENFENQNQIKINWQ